MKIYFCVKNSAIDILKDKPSLHKMSKIKIKFSKPKSISRREFGSVVNMEYIDVTDGSTGNLRLAELFDQLMDKELFEASFIDLDHHKVFEEYKKFNESFAEKLKDKVSADDLIIVNDSSLFLLPSLTNARVAFRNLRFDYSFIEKVPFYQQIIKNICLAQKFFDNKESLDSFNFYAMSSYEMKGMEKGGCWYLKPYVDKFTVIDTLEHILELVNQKTVNPACLDENKFSKRFDYELLKYLYDFPIPKTRKRILTDVNLIHLEPFIKKHPLVHVRYLRTDVEFNDDTSRMIQYLKKMYRSSFSIADTTEYSEIIAEMFYCDVFVGTQHKEIAQLFGRPVIDECYDPIILSNEVEQAIYCNESKKYEVIGEEEYLKEFMSVNGYEIVLNQSSNEDETIEKLCTEICQKVCNHPKPPRNMVYYKKIGEEGEGGVYIKKRDELPKRVNESYYPILFGENTYFDLKKKVDPVVPKELVKDEVLKAWEKSNKTILLDYDGTLTTIVDDPDKAILSQKTKDILLKLAKSSKVVVCSGRTQEKLDEWIPKEIEVYGEHGACHRINGKWDKVPVKTKIFGISKEIMQYYLKRTPGTRMEEKTAGICFHYRLAPDFCLDKLYTLLRKVGGENVQMGKMNIEVKGANKAQACKTVNPAICVGDDLTDEDMFKVCQGINIKIGDGPSFANMRLKSVDELIDLLSELGK